MENYKLKKNKNLKVYKKMKKKKQKNMKLGDIEIDKQKFHQHK